MNRYSIFFILMGITTTILGMQNTPPPTPVDQFHPITKSNSVPNLFSSQQESECKRLQKKLKSLSRVLLAERQNKSENEIPPSQFQQIHKKTP
jgi:hypothetical protein